MQNNLFDEVDVRGSESFEDLEVMLDIKNHNDPSPRPDNKLGAVIKTELNFLEGQLEQITSKLKTNYDSLILKQSENEEMRKIIEFYSLSSDGKSPKGSCSCSSNCNLY